MQTKHDLQPTSFDKPDTKRARISKEDATLRKRAPLRPQTLPTDIYVTTSSSYKGQLARAKKLLVEDGQPFIVLHAMGAAIERAIGLAMGINTACSGQVRCHTETATVDLVDDIIPADTEMDFDTNTRQNSAVHIRIEMLQPMPGTQREQDYFASLHGNRKRR
ncbi:ribonucleases P/MRP protein subunit pop7 [Linnemannia hyalina]|uniref:Ribonucleases P/MRP protein subunit pop7 n=1 Tax=Linnemannia hyalina TaxID=64524 RepID=A0A9P7XZU7_9FUNG|nr:ribonucleases P/MRP protein subunit pop7 [Linnemannia hyalina]